MIFIGPEASVNTLVAKKCVYVELPVCVRCEDSFYEKTLACLQLKDRKILKHFVFVCSDPGR